MACPPPALPADAPPVIELYAPGHFGNSYEVLGQYEMRRVLAEAKHWGFNRYGDWFDMEDCSEPFGQKRLVQLAHAMWETKKTNFRTAQSLGLACDFLITPNHVYADQFIDPWKAEMGGRMFGQLICPSKPDARRAILSNYENLFADLARSGVKLSAIGACPYDFGGCACKQCSPWILTFAKLMREIHGAALRHHPGVAMHMVGWWWTAEEHRLFADWCNRETPGWVKSMYLHIPYGKTDVGEMLLPKGCRRGAFVHIGYCDVVTPRDIYGLLGPVVAPERLEKTVRDLKAHGVIDYMAYSEGVCDDVNKALMAGLASGKFRTADEVLAAYAKRYFKADDATAAQWVAWLKSWGRSFAVDTAQSASALKDLLKTAPPGDWRLRQWELKQELFRWNAAVMRETTWTPNRLDAADQFWQVRERLQRDVWGLGPQRHIFEKRFTPVPWYADWAKHMAKQLGTIGKEQ